MDIEREVNDFLQQININERFVINQRLNLKLNDNLRLCFLCQEQTQYSYTPLLVLSLEFDYKASDLEQISLFLQQEAWTDNQNQNSFEISLGAYQSKMMLFSTMDYEFSALELKNRCEYLLAKYQQYFGR